MPGRKRKPTHLHIVQGTAQPCRMNKLEPKAPTEAPQPAIELNSRASYWYGVLVGRIQSLGVASIADSEQVMLLAIRMEEVEALTADIDANGRTLWVEQVQTYHGRIMYGEGGKPLIVRVPHPNPAVGQRSDALRHAQSLLAEFGLSPASRGKVSKQPKEAPANRWEALK